MRIELERTTTFHVWGKAKRPGRLYLGWRTTDVRHRPSPHGSTGNDPARRTFMGLATDRRRNLLPLSAIPMPCEQVNFLLAEQNTPGRPGPCRFRVHPRERAGRHGGAADELRNNEDVKEFYLWAFGGGAQVLQECEAPTAAANVGYSGSRRALADVVAGLVG